EGQAQEKNKSLSGLDVRVSDKSELPVIRQDEKIEIHTGNLSLSEMLALADKVESWGEKQEKSDGALIGSVQNIVIKIDWRVGFIRSFYNIQANIEIKSAKSNLGIYEYKETTELGKEIKKRYFDYLRKVREVSSEEKEDAIKLAKSLINK
ncbi:MAG: hypothetical protein Q7S33_03490, partial [Nanoarchaeota archaeon]|nr:hypothetical protein [Nanoarchaeota archaeon]